MTAPETPDSLGGDDPDTVDDTSLEQLDEAESLDDPDLADQLRAVVAQHVDVGVHDRHRRQAAQVRPGERDPRVTPLVR